MDGVVSWVVEIAVKPGRLEAFRALMDEMVSAVRADPGAVIYEWFIDDDDRVVHIYERYADSAAAMRHMEVFGRFAERYLAETDPLGFTLMGSPTDEVRAALSDDPPLYLRSFGGFAR
jgi:quinol monooxygenase YgiN